MKRSRFTEEQVAYALRQAEGGTAVADAISAAGYKRGNLLRVEVEAWGAGSHGASINGVAGVQCWRWLKASPDAASRRP